MDNEGVQKIIDIARLAAGAQLLTVTEPSVREEPIPLIVRTTKDGVVVEPVQALLDAWRLAPKSRQGSANAETLASFIELIKRHKDNDSAIFAGITSAYPSLTAVIDYHTKDHEPRFGQHRICYLFPLSPEWRAWRAMDGKSMLQGDWAAFVEEHIAELASPLAAEKSEFERLFQTKIATPAELITLSRGMQISIEAKIKDIRTLQSGEVQVAYEETHNDAAGVKLVIPGLFVLQIPLFLDGEPVRITARLRYRRDGAKIVWFYQLYRPDLAMRAQLEADLQRVADETGLPAYEGSPEA